MEASTTLVTEQLSITVTPVPGSDRRLRSVELLIEPQLEHVDRDDWRRVVDTLVGSGAVSPPNDALVVRCVDESNEAVLFSTRRGSSNGERVALLYTFDVCGSKGAEIRIDWPKFEIADAKVPL